MKNNPLVSVIITNYNYGQYISKAIESVIAQTYPNIELVIINDGSTDNSHQIIKSLIKKNPGKNIRYINRANKGVVYTRNEGIELARGEFISYLDADDYFNKSYINKSYQIAKEYNADVVYPNWHFVGEWLGRPDTNFPEFNPKLLQLQKLHCTPASLIRKSAIGGYRFRVEEVAEDWDFFIGLSLGGATFKLAKDNYINYRIRKGTRASRNDPREDTRHFVDILTRYRNEYGDKVINPSKLVALRHPSLVRRVLGVRMPLTVVESIKRDGVRGTVKKVPKRMIDRNKIIWNLMRQTRNKKFERILANYKVQKSSKAKLAVVVHLYYPELWPLMKSRLQNIKAEFDLFVSVQQKHKNISLENVGKYHKETNIVALPNRGRDTLPFLLISRIISNEEQYEYILKLHSKKSLHRGDGAEWLESLLDELIPDDPANIIKTLKRSSTGAVGPSSHIVSLSRYMGGNKEKIKSIAGSIPSKPMIDSILKTPSHYPFFGGTMFWCRVDFLKPLLESDLAPADFNTEDGQVDGTTAHALERMLGRILHKITGRKMYSVGKKGVVVEVPERSYTARYRHVESK